ncbi:MAG TPA: AbrB/MazE/SpoVT family DNA-binding domain-containing protein [Sphingomonas sp.]|jgi:AbrB family looped-hinge helix DNA binding protein
MTYLAKVIAGGKVVIPAEIRRELGIKDGDSLVVERDATGAMVLKTYAQVAAEVRAEFRRLRGADVGGPSIVDELIADRREEARRENDELERWVSERP